MQTQIQITVFVKLDYWDAYRLQVYLTARILRKLLTIFAVVALLWVGVLVLLMLRPSSDADWARTVRNSTPMVWMVVIVPFLIFVVPLYSARRMTGDNRIVRGYTYIFSSDGVHIAGPVSKSDFLWTAIQRVSESKSMFLVYTNPNIAFALPKRCFDNEEMVTAMRQMFREMSPKQSLSATKTCCRC